MRFQSKILIITILVSILIPFNSFSQTDTIQTEESYLKYNQTDKNGKRQWLWINYTHIGVRCGWSYIKSIGYYRDDNKIGDWNYYTKDGFIKNTIIMIQRIWKQNTTIITRLNQKEQ